MKYASVCSGVEAASLAWMPLGWEPVWFSEIEPFPCEVLAQRFPGVPNLGDMTKIEGEKYRGTIDIIVGGTPCQGFSLAGKKGGIKDPRSGLCLAYCRLLKTVRPRWFVWENVPGVFSTNGGEDFKAFLREIDEIGYSCAWRVLDAQYVRVDGYPRAVPQRRRRVFVVGYLGDWRYPASVLFEPDCLFRNSPPRRKTGAGVARSVTASTGGASGKEQQLDFVGGDGQPLNVIESGSGFYSESKTAQTLKAQEDQHRRNIVCMATGQGGAETSEDCAVNLTCNHEAPIVGAFMPGQGAKAGSIAYSEDHAPALRAGDSGTNREGVLCQYGDIAGTLTERHDSSPCDDRGMPIVYENHGQDSRVKECGGCSPPINAKAGTGGGNLPLVQAIAIAENVIGRRVENGGNGFGTKEEVAYTQNCTEVMGVAQNTSVRRLLPVECERLMGFPDNHTRIPWKGKPEEDCPDSPRYKACGNSMCVNVMRWIGMRIELVERKIKN